MTGDLMRRSTSTKLIGLLSAFFYTFAVLAANVQPNLYTDKIHLTGETGTKVLTLDINKQIKSSTITPTQLLDLGTSTDANTPSTLVKRDGSGNFSAGTITATLNGTATSASTRFTFTSQTSNYTASFGDWIDCTGASFNVTLPDATTPNTSGRPIVVQHNGTSLSSVFTILTTGGQTIVGAPNSTAYTSGQVALYTNQEHMEFWPTGTGWKLKLHQSNTGWTDLGTWMKYITFTVSSAAATLAAVYSPAITFTLVAAGNATAAATYVPSWVYTVSPAAATAAATYNPAWVYTVTAANATLADVYKDVPGNSYTVAATIAGATTLVTTSTSTPPASGTLTRFSGTGDLTINYSSVAGNPSNQGTYTVAATIAAATTLVTTSPATTPNASGRLVKLAGTGDAVIQYTAIAGAPSTTTTCTTAATIAAQTSVVKTCTADPPTVGTLTKTAGTGDLTLPYNAWVGENTAAGTKAYRVANTIAAGLTLTTQNEVTLPSLSSGKLGKISGTGDTVITYSAVTGAINLIGISTAGVMPTFYGLPFLNNWKWRRVEGDMIEIWINFGTPVAGVAGTGSYLFPMVPNVTINTTLAPISVAAGGGFQSTTEVAEQATLTQFQWPATGKIDITAVNYALLVGAVPWSSTQFRNVILWSISTNPFSVIGSSFATASNGTLGYNLRYKFPAQGWIP